MIMRVIAAATVAFAAALSPPVLVADSHIDLKSELQDCATLVPDDKRLECYDRITLEHRDPAPATGTPLPAYDVEAYCAEVAKMAGGSYALEKSCRDMEAGAKAALEARSVEPKIMQYCDDVASMAGGSYNLLDSCISMEEQARNAMKSGS